jgi:hypothetical protein
MKRLVVMPNLATVVEMAKEAQIQILDVAFVTHPPSEVDPIRKWLIALNIEVEGPQESLGYFAYLLKQRQLTAA